MAARKQGRTEITRMQAKKGTTPDKQPLTRTAVPKPEPTTSAPAPRTRLAAGASIARVPLASPQIPTAASHSPAPQGPTSHLKQQIGGTALLLVALLFLTTLLLSVFADAEHALGPLVGNWLSKFLLWNFGAFPATMGSVVLGMFAVRLVVHDQPLLRKIWALSLVLWAHGLLFLGLGELLEPLHDYTTFVHSGGLWGHLLVRAFFLPVFGPHRLGPVLILLTSLVATGLWALRITPREGLLVFWATCLQMWARAKEKWEARKNASQGEHTSLEESAALARAIEPRGRFLDRHLRPEPEDGQALDMPSSVILPPAAIGMPEPEDEDWDTPPAMAPQARPAAAQSPAAKPAARAPSGVRPPDPEAGLGDRALGVYRNLSAWRPLSPEDLVGLNPLEIRRLKARDEEVRLAAQLNEWEDREVRAQVSKRPKIAPEPKPDLDPDPLDTDLPQAPPLPRAPRRQAPAAALLPELEEEWSEGAEPPLANWTESVNPTAGELDEEPLWEEPIDPAPVRRGGVPKAEPRAEPARTNPFLSTGGVYRIPDLSILTDPPPAIHEIDEAELQGMAEALVLQLRNFGVSGKVIQIEPGPVITRFKVELAPGTPVRKIINLADDLALTLRAKRIRIQAPIPGESLVGIEIPNTKPEVVHLKEILHAPQYRDASLKLPVVLGKDIVGNPVVTDLAKAPHLLIAGQTGSGKSVCINTIMASFLFSQSPARLRMILVDPKVVELSTYQKIPHLLAPVVTKPDEAVAALKWVAWEMDRRYDVLAKAGVRNIAGFNEKIDSGAGVPDAVDPADRAVMPYLVVVIDEFADLMMVAGKEVETAVARIAQKARAVGIHLMLATQRPSTNVITGVLKANLPTRIAFQVASQIDARTILDKQGAEDLLGRGDMLFRAVDAPEPRRVHGAFVTDADAEAVAMACANQDCDFPMLDTFLTESDQEFVEEDSRAALKIDAKFADAARLVVAVRQGSTSMLQRRMEIGFARAGRIMDQLEKFGVVGKDRGSKAREVIIDEVQLEGLLDRLLDP
ncbi:MAG: hypothetical protein RL318_2675 [Fibrobacterota bacterium]|jgi:S-DNA-T family DNA segregation ATPase FtsK/SpoIIIE